MGSYYEITKNNIVQKNNPSWNHWELLSLSTTGGDGLNLVNVAAHVGDR